MVLLALATVMTMSLGVGGAPPAGSHARVTGTDPVDGAVVTQLPERVTVFLGTKPATIEGDPVRVHGPDGARVDAGDPTLVHLGGEDRAAASVSVGLDRAAVEASGPGELRVAYRVVSEDSHLIAGSFGFTYEPAAASGAPGGGAAAGPAGSAAGPARGAAAADGGSGGGRGETAAGLMVRQEPPPGQWPKVVFGAAVALAAAGALGRRGLRARRDVARRLEAVAARREAATGGYAGGADHAGSGRQAGTWGHAGTGGHAGPGGHGGGGGQAGAGGHGGPGGRAGAGGHAGPGRVGAGVGGIAGIGGFGTRPWTD